MKAECRKIYTFKLWCCRRLLRVSQTARRSNQSILQKINPEYSLERLMLKLKLQYFGHLMLTANSMSAQGFKSHSCGSMSLDSECQLTSLSVLVWAHQYICPLLPAKSPRWHRSVWTVPAAHSLSPLVCSHHLPLHMSVP